MNLELLEQIEYELEFTCFTNEDARLSSGRGSFSDSG